MKYIIRNSVNYIEFESDKQFNKRLFVERAFMSGFIEVPAYEWLLENIDTYVKISEETTLDDEPVIVCKFFLGYFDIRRKMLSNLKEDLENYQYDIVSCKWISKNVIVANVRTKHGCFEGTIRINYASFYVKATSKKKGYLHLFQDFAWYFAKKNFGAYVSNGHKNYERTKTDKMVKYEIS